MSGVTDISPSTFLSDSLSLLMGNFFALMGNSAGTAFPTVNLRESMFFYHTAEKKVYVLARMLPTVEWKELLDLNALLGSAGNRVAYYNEVQNLLSQKQANVTGAATTLLTNNLVADIVAITNPEGKIVSSDVAVTKLAFIKTLTSNAQTQLDGKQNKVTISTVPPTASEGVNNDVWMVIE